MHRLSLFLALSLGTLASVAGVAVSSAAADGLSPHAYSIGRIGLSSATWNLVKATMEVRSGAISDADILYVEAPVPGGFIDQTLWASNYAGTTWVELGYSRGWRPEYPDSYNILTPYWANQQTDGDYIEHRVTAVSISDGENRTFKIRKVSSNTYQVCIGDTLAADEKGDATATDTIGAYIRWVDCGMKTNASSGRLGTSSNPVNDTYILESSNYGSSWVVGPNQGYRRVDPDSGGYGSYGGWDSATQSLHNHRNTNQ